MNRALVLSHAILIAACPAAGFGADVAQWDFEGDLESTTGNQVALTEGVAAPGLSPEFSFETQPIGGSDASVLHFQRGTFFHARPGLPPNGGGGYMNQYTIVMDVMFPHRVATGGWASLYQTNELNENDGDWFIEPAGRLGVDGIYGGSVPEGEWHRLALVVDLVAGTYTSFVDGVQAQQLTGQLLDDRFSLYSVNDGDLDGFWIFADESSENAEGYINSLQFRDLALSATDILALGGPSADGIPIPSDPRDCSFRDFKTQFDLAANTVTGTWLTLPDEHGFRVFQGARQIGGDLPPSATSFVDASPPAGGVGLIYRLLPLTAGGGVERECSAPPIDTFECIQGLTCCVDQSTSRVTLTWEPAQNITPTGFRVSRNGGLIDLAGPGDTTFTDTTVTSPGNYGYEVTVLNGVISACAATCRATVTGIPIAPPGTCGGVVNTYDFNGNLASSTGGRDLVPMTSAPIDPVSGSPVFDFESSEIGGQNAQVCRYSRGTFFRLFTGMGPNGGGAYTNQYTLMMDVLFETGQIDESGWAALLQTNDSNANEGDWFINGLDRGLGVDGNHGGFVSDEEWHRIALVVDNVAGMFTSYLDGVMVQQNAGLAIDDRFALYTFNDGDFEGFSIFADNAERNSAGLVNSVSVRDVALGADEIAAFGTPTASGIPASAPCPHGLACAADQTARSVTLSWQKGGAVTGDGFTIRRNGEVVATVPLATTTHTDPGLAPGAYLYEVTLTTPNACDNLPLTCRTEIIGSRLFFDDFEAYETDGDLVDAGWQLHDENSPVENATWTVTNPGQRANPTTADGKPSTGRFVISDSAWGGSDQAQNTAGSGASYDLWSPTFSAAGTGMVWLHFDASAQLNNLGDAVLGVDVSTDGGGTWSSVLERVSPGRLVAPLPQIDDNADGLHGRVHVELSSLAANEASVRLRFRHFEPTWEWFIALDNVLVDSSPPDGGGVEILPREEFAGGIPPAWRTVSGPDGDATGPWDTEDTCSLKAPGFPDGAEGRQLHHLGSSFALIHPVCSSAMADEYLITPSLNLSGQGRVFLGVESAVLPTTRAVAEILVSLDGGTSFLPAPLFSYNAGGLSVPEEDPSFDEMVLEAPLAAGKPNVAFAFHYRSLGSAPPAGTWWAINGVRVTGISSSQGGIFRRGDADANGSVNITDAVRILNVLFLGLGTIDCNDAADSDDNGTVNITDAVRILNVLFLGIGSIPAPGADECGADPTEDTAGCVSYEVCDV